MGHGGQARAWAECLRESGWSVEIYLRSPEKAPGARPLSALAGDLADGFPIGPTGAITSGAPAAVPALVAMLCSDAAIAPVYERYLRGVQRPLQLVLAHGFAIYSRTLTELAPEHAVALFAPKAIGPQIVTKYRAGRPHALKAAVTAEVAASRDTAKISGASRVRAMAEGMGFDPANFIETTFEKETIGDLISEQGLLCGGVFALLDWTWHAMREAGVPEALIREECLSELELVAGLLSSRGPAQTFATISDAAKVGTLLVREDFEASDLHARLRARFEEVLDGRFGQRFLAQDWQPAIANQITRLRRLEVSHELDS